MYVNNVCLRFWFVYQILIKIRRTADILFWLNNLSLICLYLIDGVVITCLLSSGPRYKGVADGVQNVTNSHIRFSYPLSNKNVILVVNIQIYEEGRGQTTGLISNDRFYTLSVLYICDRFRVFHRTLVRNKVVIIPRLNIIR